MNLFKYLFEQNFSNKADLEGGVEDVGCHDRDEAVPLGLEALPHVPLQEGAQGVLHLFNR